jgi:hypothetical protein
MNTPNLLQTKEDPVALELCRSNLFLSFPELDLPALHAS